MKKKISFIDLFIDEWHANNYPAWIRNSSLADEFELAYAWEEVPKEGLRSLDTWCKDFGMTPVSSLEEAVDKADCIFVLAPSNPEVHERLADYALKAGKPLYIDKPFAPSLAAAERMFALAEKHGTPLMTSSALRFGDELLQGDIKKADPLMLTTTGGGRSYHEYAIHQLEMIVSVMGTEVENIVVTGNKDRASVTLEYSRNRLASLAYAPCFPFSVMASAKDKNFVFPEISRSFENLLESILTFFKTGVSCISKAETLAIADLLEKTVAQVEK